MNEFIPNYRTRAGVEVMVREDGGCKQVSWNTKLGRDNCLFTQREFAALFEPIPKPVMVTVLRHDAQMLRDHFTDAERQQDWVSRLVDATLAAEREAANRDNPHHPD